MEETYKTIELIVKHQKKSRQDKKWIKLLVDAEALLEHIPTLINHSVDKESAYRKFEATMSDQVDSAGKRYTSSYCDTQAKATDMYAEWRKADKFIEWMYEAVNLSKKLGDTIGKDERNG